MAGIELVYVGLMSVFAYLSVNTKENGMLQLLFLIQTFGFGLITVAEASAQGATLGEAGILLSVLSLFAFLVFWIGGLMMKLVEWYNTTW